MTFSCLGGSATHKRCKWPLSFRKTAQLNLMHAMCARISNHSKGQGSKVGNNHNRLDRLTEAKFAVPSEAHCSS